MSVDDVTGGEGPGAGLSGGDLAGGQAPADGEAAPGGAESPGGGEAPGCGEAPDGAEAPGGGDAGAGDASARLTAWVAGQVQGVGLRWWIRARALELGLVGSAENLEDGRVKVVAEGAVTRCRELLALLAGPGTPGRVSRVTQRWDDPRGGITGFTER
jgi:acylphosphatase